MKRVVFLVKGDPFSWKTHEAFRVGMAVGINSEVSLILIKDGVYTLSKWHPEKLEIYGFDKLLENLSHVNVSIYVEDASAEERGLKETDFVKEVKFISIEEIKEIISSSEAVFVW